MKIFKKIIASLSIFFLLFPMFWNTYAYNQNTSVDKTWFLKMLKNKQITTKWISYLVKKRLDSSDFAYLKTIKWKKANELKKDKKVLEIVKKIIWNGISSTDMSYMKKNSYINSTPTPTVWVWASTSVYTSNKPFLEFIGNKNYKVNFKDITVNNAWKVLQTWEWKANFPDKFVLENNFNLEINELDLDKLFERSNEIKQNFETLKARWVQLWKINLKEPVLKVLPDRIQIVKETEVKFKTSTELNNIKTKLNIWLSDKKTNEIKTSLNAIKTKSSPSIKKLSGNLKKEFNNNLDLDNAVKKWLIEDCKEYNKTNNKKRNCSKTQIEKDINNLEKTIVTTETQEISLLPPNTFIWDKNTIKMKAQDIRLSKWQINSIFDKYWELIKIKNNKSDKTKIKRETEFERWENIYANKNYCKIISGIDKNIDENNIENNKDIEDEKKIKFTACKELLKRKNTPEVQSYKQNLLNWFTLWESHSYSFWDKIYLHYFFGKKKLAEFNVRFWYSYGFWVRIPMIAEVKIDKDRVDDFWENWKYNFYTKLDTLDAPASFYKDVWLEEKKVFNGKEFVFELSSGIDFKLRLIWNIINIDEKVPLISLLATYFKESGKSFFGFKWDDLNYIIENNWLNKSSDFIPPFDWANKILLLDNISVDIPIYEIPSTLVLATRLWVDVSLDWKVKSKLNMVNSKNCRTYNNELCPSYINLKRYDPNSAGAQNTNSIFNVNNLSEHFNEVLKWNYSKYSAEATFDADNFKEDSLWQYSNFWIKLDNFRYIPKLVFDIFVQWLLSVKIPLRWWESFSSPKIKVYSFTISSDDIYLGTHTWTKWKLDATTNNKVYTTNPEIDLQTPQLEIKWTNDNATFEMLNNKSGFIKTYYSINWKTPSCEYEIEWTKQYLWKTKIWETPYNDLVKNKLFKIQIVSCSIFWEASKVKKSVINLENGAFDFDFEFVDPYVDKVKSSTKIKIMPTKYNYVDYIKYVYTLDWTTPTCKGWILYENKSFDFKKYAQTILKNDFKITLKWLACNKQNWTINKVFTKSYDFHNDALNPTIDLSNTIETIFQTYNYNKNNYQTYIVYWQDKENLACHDLQNYQISMMKEVVNWDTLTATLSQWFPKIYAKSCIVNEKGKLVFSSDTIYETNKIQDFINKEKERENIKNKTDRFKIIDKDRLDINKQNLDINPNKINKDPIVNPWDNLKKDLTPIKKDLTPIKKDLTPINNKFNNNLQHNTQQIDNNLKINNNFNDNKFNNNFNNKQINWGLNFK